MIRLDSLLLNQTDKIFHRREMLRFAWHFISIFHHRHPSNPIKQFAIFVAQTASRVQLIMLLNLKLSYLCAYVCQSN